MVVIKLNCSLCHICAIVPYMYHCTICIICAIYVLYVPYLYQMYYMCHMYLCAIYVPYVLYVPYVPYVPYLYQLLLWKLPLCNLYTWSMDSCNSDSDDLESANVGNGGKCWKAKMKSMKRGFRTQGQSLVVQKRLVEEEGMVKARDLRPVSSKSGFSCRQKSASKDKISKDQLCAKVLSCCAAQQENPFKLLPLSTNSNGSWVLCRYMSGMQWRTWFLVKVAHNSCAPYWLLVQCY